MTNGHPNETTVTPPAAQLDPDRFFNRTSPGAHEWWYFDAISDDGRDAIVIVWYAGLPFDPAYGVATLRHLKNPSKYPQPRALDHSAIGFSWYRDGKTIAYALNGFRADRFRHEAEPFAVEVATNRVERDGGGYRLTIATPDASKAARSAAEFRFHPADSTEPFERDLGTPDAPHNWILAAGDCRVEGKASIGGDDLTFGGRGYHDHNAGAEDLSIAMKRWEWGRVHHGPLTNDLLSHPSPMTAIRRSLWITCRDGSPRGDPRGFAGQRRADVGPERLRASAINRLLRFTDGTNALFRSTDPAMRRRRAVLPAVDRRFGSIAAG